MRNNVVARYLISGRPASDGTPVGIVNMYLACARGAADLAADLVTKRGWTDVSIRDQRAPACIGEVCK